MIEIFADETDDPEYLQTVVRIVNGCAQEYAPAGVYTVRIRGWFDHKWLGFSGKVLGAFAIWKRPLTLPPFNPSRVLSQRYYHWHPQEQVYLRATGWMRLHRRQTSSDNLRRRVGSAGRSIVLVWFCNQTLSSGRGSLMVYVRTQRKRAAWFVSLEKKESGWRKQTSNIAVAQVEEFEAVGAAMDGG